MNLCIEQEYLEHLKGEEHSMRIRAYHDVNDSVLEILRANARVRMIHVPC